MGEEEWGASDACEGPGENDCLNALGLGSQRHGLNRVDDGEEAVKAHQNQSVDADVGQVWSLTQFFCASFSQSRMFGVFSTNTQLNFASVVLDGVLGPLRLARHT